jgi:hypothetical protein
VSLRDRHLWIHDGHFNVLEWGGVDLYAYLEKYGIDCSGVAECWEKSTNDDSALVLLWRNLCIVHGAERERDFRFLYDTILSSYDSSLETVLTILEGDMIYSLFGDEVRYVYVIINFRDPFD